MVDESAQHGLTRLLAGTARAHHDATGGSNDSWAQWYAEHLAGKIDDFVGFSPSVETIGEWLVAADDKQRAEDPDGHWPSAYARYILAEPAAP
jgi:hypothetical protein